MKLHNNIILFIVICIILLILRFVFRKQPNYNLVPRKIWTYWDAPNTIPNKIPKSVKLCMESWKKHNPDYEIVLLTRKNFKGYVTIPVDVISHPHYNDSNARFSDLVRLYVLEEHGGVWIDASILVKTSLDEWMFPKYAEFSGFYMKSVTHSKTAPVIESWFLAANRNSQFIKLWKKEFLEMTRFIDINKYLESRKQMGVNFEKIRDPHYLAVYIAALKVLTIDKYPLDTLILRDSEKGPFKYLKDTQWYSEKAMKLACSDKKYQTPLIKFRSSERKLLDESIDYDLSPEKCGWLD